MKFAILFQFFKDIDVCRNRLKLLKKFNPDIPIYGLFGGEASQADKFRQALGAEMEDFFCF